MLNQNLPVGSALKARRGGLWASLRRSKASLIRGVEQVDAIVQDGACIPAAGVAVLVARWAELAKGVLVPSRRRGRANHVGFIPGLLTLLGGLG